MKLDKRSQVIKTSMELFVNQGFENTPTSQISEEANVATGTLFYHFKTKEELINEIYKFVKRDMKKSLMDNFSKDFSTRDIIKTFWVKLLKWGFENELENKFLTKFYGSIYISKITVEELSEDFKDGKLILEKAKKEGLIKDISVELLERITMNLYNSFLPEFYKEKKLNKNLLEESFEIYFDAIKR